MGDQQYYRDRAEHFLRLAALSSDAQTADLLWEIAADFSELASEPGTVGHSRNSKHFCCSPHGLDGTQKLMTKIAIEPSITRSRGR
jgi:hypothetical protein